jgi:hypothetical protein
MVHVLKQIMNIASYYFPLFLQLILDAERVQLPRLPLSGEGEKGSPGEQLYEVCVCPDGRLYLSKAGHTSTCHDNSHNC